MAESQKRDPSTVSSKEKDSLLDLDIGNDFLSSWKSMSMAEGDGMDFDLTPGNKKSFNFDKADMDFNFDGDFGKVSSFNMDMSDLDISPPLKNDGKSSEKPKESSSGKKKEKPDPFAFAFDFDPLDNFNFESSFTKECSKDQKEKSKKVNPPSGSECQDAEGSVRMKEIGSTTTLEDSPPNPSRLGAVVTFDMGSLGGGGADLESKKENRSSNLEMDGVLTSGHSASIHEITSDQAKRNPKPTVASRELPKDSELEKFVSTEPVELEASSRNDVVRDLSSDSVPKNDPSGGNPLEAHGKVKSVNTNEMGSTRKQDVKVISVDSSFRHCTPTIYEDSPLPTVEISEKKSIVRSKVGVADHVINKKQMSSTNDEVQDLSSDSLSKNEPTGPNPSGTQAQDKANPVSTNATGSTRNPSGTQAQDKANPVCKNAAGSTRKHDVNQTVKISENISGKSKVGVEDHVVNKMKTPSRNDSLRDLSSDSVPKNEPTGGNPSEAHFKIDSVNTNKTGSTRKQDVKVISFDSSFRHAVEISGKWSSEKSKVGTEGHTMKKMQAASRNDAERDLPPDSLFKNEPTEKQDVNVISFDSSSCHRAHPISENSPFPTVDISEKKSSAKSKFSVEDHVLNKQAPSRSGAVRDLSSEPLSKNEPFRVEVLNKQTPSKNEPFRVEDHVLNKKTPSRSVRDLSAEPLSKNEPIGGNSLEEQDKVNSVNTNASGSNRKEDVNMIPLNSSSYHHMFSSKCDSTKSPLRKYIKPVGNIGQNRVLLRNISSGVADFPSSQNQTLSTLSTKRKTLEEDSTSTTVLPPSKRLTQSLTTTRNVVEMPEKVLHEKVPDHGNMETKSINSTLIDIPHEANIKEVTMPFSIESDNIIKQAESYARELDALCNMLKKKDDEAKEILVQAVVNSNELLMLYSPVLDMKILETQNIFARFQI